MIHKNKSYTNMQTRSQTKTKSLEKVGVMPTESIISVGILRKELEVDIDFDEASRAWYLNKKPMPNSMCKYICMEKTKMGKPCSKRPMQWQNYCCIHI